MAKLPTPDRASGLRGWVAAAPDPGLGVTAVGAAVVTVVCAVASYTHIAHLAQQAGQGELAGWLPLGVDGLVASSTASLLVDRRAGRHPGLSAILGLGLGLTGSLAANLVAVDPTLVSPRAVRLALAGYPPVALAIAGHVLLTMLLGAPAAKAPSRVRGSRTPVSESQTRRASVAPLPEGERPHRALDHGRVGAVLTSTDGSTGDQQAGGISRQATEDDARRVAEGLGRVSIRTLGDALRAEDLTVSAANLAEWTKRIKAERAQQPEPRRLEVV